MFENFKKKKLRKVCVEILGTDYIDTSEFQAFYNLMKENPIEKKYFLISEIRYPTTMYKQAKLAKEFLSGKTIKTDGGFILD